MRFWAALAEPNKVWQSLRSRLGEGSFWWDNNPEKEGPDMNRRNQTKGFQAEQHASVLRAARYLRVSTGRQAEHDLSIPDQRAQLKSWCRTHGYSVAAEFVEGASAGSSPCVPTDDR
jgi:hypothetical protein